MERDRCSTDEARYRGLGRTTRFGWCERDDEPNRDENRVRKPEERATGVRGDALGMQGVRARLCRTVAEVACERSKREKGSGRDGKRESVHACTMQYRARYDDACAGWVNR